MKSSFVFSIVAASVAAVAAGAFCIFSDSPSFAPVSDLMCSCCRIFTYRCENSCVDNYKLGYYEMRIFHWPQLKINHFLNGIYMERMKLIQFRTIFFLSFLSISIVASILLALVLVNSFNFDSLESRSFSPSSPLSLALPVC